MILVKYCLSFGKSFYLNYEYDLRIDYVFKGFFGFFILIDIMKNMKIIGILKIRSKNMIN